MPTLLYLRKGTTAQWSATNPTLASGEIGYDTTTKVVRIGGQNQTWSNLSSAFLGPTGSSGTSSGLLKRVQWYVQSTPPAGMLACNGSIVSSVTYPNLDELPTVNSFSGGIGIFSTMTGADPADLPDFGYGPGETFASTDSMFGTTAYTFGGRTYPKGTGAIIPVLTYGQNWDSGAYYAPPWIWGYKFPYPVVINKFAILCISNNFLDAFEFQGSIDGITYTTIQTYSGYSSSAQNGIIQTVNNLVEYTHYRFYMTSFTGNVGNIKTIGLQGIPFTADPILRVLPKLDNIITSNGITFYPYISV